MSCSPWMPRVLSLALLLAASAAAAQEDAPNCKGKDHPLFTRMPGYYLSTGAACKEEQFARFTFPTKDGNTPVEGHLYKYSYTYRGQGPAPSAVQVGRNYANAATTAGGEVLFSDSHGTTAVRFKQAGKQTWAKVWGGGSGINLLVVEVEAMKQDVTANADALKGGLAATGHVELVGIFFDTGKSELKPESEPSLGEMEKLLKAQPQLALWVVGHTDSVGSVESNMALSQARAAAVVKALVEQRGVDSRRLAPHGAGPYAPVATNTTEEGRAKNRRVELVAR